MQKKRLFQLGGVLLSALILSLLLIAPAPALARSTQAAHRTDSATSIDASVYLTNSMLQSMFQDRINQQLPQIVNSTIANMISGLPQQDQGWASQMASALLQPSATLLSLTPKANGLQAVLKINLYDGDPKPITTTLVIGFSLTNPSTIQVTALPDPSGPSLVSGPLATFTVPIGSLTSINATPNCGDANLGVQLKFPIALNQQSSVQSSGGTAPVSYTQPLDSHLAGGQDSYIELPSASLAQLGGSIGIITISKSLTAHNIRIGVQGSDLTQTSDIFWYGLGIGTAVSTLAPSAVNGNLVVHVLSTHLNILGGMISFPMNSYNQQIEQQINSRLNGALAGKFTVAQAAIGPNAHLPCAASDSLVLGGSISLV